MKKEYRIMGFYYGEWEEVFCETTKPEALARLSEYRINEPETKFKLQVVRVK